MIELNGWMLFVADENLLSSTDADKVVFAHMAKLFETLAAVPAGIKERWGQEFEHRNRSSKTDSKIKPARTFHAAIKLFWDKRARALGYNEKWQ